MCRSAVERGQKVMGKKEEGRINRKLYKAVSVVARQVAAEGKAKNDAANKLVEISLLHPEVLKESCLAFLGLSHNPQLVFGFMLEGLNPNHGQI